MEPADSKLLEYVADGFASGDFLGDNDHAREIAERLRARAKLVAADERKDHALTEVCLDNSVVARFRRISEAHKHVREVLAGATYERDRVTYNWQLGPLVLFGRSLTHGEIQIFARYPLPPPQ